MVGNEKGKSGIEGTEHGMVSGLMIIMDDTVLRSCVPRFVLISRMKR